MPLESIPFQDVFSGIQTRNDCVRSYDASIKLFVRAVTPKSSLRSLNHPTHSAVQLLHNVAHAFPVKLPKWHVCMHGYYRPPDVDESRRINARQLGAKSQNGTGTRCVPSPHCRPLLSSLRYPFSHPTVSDFLNQALDNIVWPDTLKKLRLLRQPWTSAQSIEFAKRVLAHSTSPADTVEGALLRCRLAVE